MANIKARSKLRTGTLAAWTSANPILLAGEPGFESDTQRLRIGDGASAFLSLPFIETRSTPIADALFPAGGIVMWSGAIVAIPAGWALCDGSNGTPDLRGRFIVGAGSAYVPGNTGGSDTVTLTEAQLPVHDHAVNLITSADPGHTHNVSGIYNAGIFHNQGGSTNISSNGQVGHGSAPGKNTDAGGSHTHAVTGNTDNAGSGSAHENRPPYYALAYIMKL